MIRVAREDFPRASFEYQPSTYVGDGTPDDMAAVAAAIDIACREVGFVRIHGHGIEPASRVNDFFEAYNVGRCVDDYPDVPVDVAQHYATNIWPAVAGFEAKVSAYFSDALGLPSGPARRRLDRDGRRHRSVGRLGGWLQALGSDGIWRDVSPEDGALLINLGDLTARLTNERWMSTLHREAAERESARVLESRR